jgi:ABC-type Mn2+/Zn2+ transport system permease subunit
MTGKFRPQIALSILCGTVFGMFGMYIGWKMGATEVVTAVIGSVFGFLGGVSLKVLEAE